MEESLAAVPRLHRLLVANRPVERGDPWLGSWSSGPTACAEASRDAVKMTCSARWDDELIWFATVFDPTADDVKTLWRLVGSYILLFSNMNVMRNQHLS